MAVQQAQISESCGNEESSSDPPDIINIVGRTNKKPNLRLIVNNVIPTNNVNDKEGNKNVNRFLKEEPLLDGIDPSLDEEESDEDENSDVIEIDEYIIEDLEELFEILLGSDEGKEDEEQEILLEETFSLEPFLEGSLEFGDETTEAYNVEVKEDSEPENGANELREEMWDNSSNKENDDNGESDENAEIKAEEKNIENEDSETVHESNISGIETPDDKKEEMKGDEEEKEDADEGNNDEIEESTSEKGQERAQDIEAQQEPKDDLESGGNIEDGEDKEGENNDDERVNNEEQVETNEEVKESEEETEESNKQEQPIEQHDGDGQDNIGHEEQTEEQFEEPESTIEGQHDLQEDQEAYQEGIENEVFSSPFNEHDNGD